MATVSYWFWSWTGSLGSDLYPGEAHVWWMWGGGFDYGDAIMLTAHPVFRPGRALAVEDVKIIRDDNPEVKLSFTVRNVGSESVPGYGVGFAWVDE